MKSDKSRLGYQYESLACSRLEAEGMQILARNYRVKTGEIDIVARDGEEIVFVEVKYRSSREYGGAMYAISAGKQQRIRRTAEWYIQQNHINPESFFRFDAVLIDGSDIEHIKNAWQ